LDPAAFLFLVLLFASAYLKISQSPAGTNYCIG
jgi:hypothetical protein